jgi:hypothetical protein
MAELAMKTTVLPRILTLHAAAPGVLQGADHSALWFWMFSDHCKAIAGALTLCGKTYQEEFIPDVMCTPEGPDTV